MAFILPRPTLITPAALAWELSQEVGEEGECKDRGHAALTLGPYCLPSRGLDLQPAFFLLLRGPGTNVSMPKWPCPAQRPLPPHPTLGSKFLLYPSPAAVTKQLGAGQFLTLAPPWAVSDTRLMATIGPRILCLVTSCLCPGPGFQDQEPSTQSQGMVTYA